jgi:hypothetical protein
MYPTVKILAFWQNWENLAENKIFILASMESSKTFILG